MTEQELQRLHDDIYTRLRHRFDMTPEAANFVINMMTSFHSCEGAAYYNMDDYMYKRGV